METNKKIQTHKQKEYKYYGEIDIAIVVESILNSEKFHSLMDEDGLRATLILETPCGKKHETEILGISTCWSDWDAI